MKECLLCHLYCPTVLLLLTVLCLKTALGKNMLLRAWKHSLQSFLPLLPPQNPNHHVDFVDRLPPPPTQSLLLNINSSSGSKKKLLKTSLRHFTPSGKCQPRPLGCPESRKVRGWEVGKAIALYERKMNLRDSQEKPVRTWKFPSLHWSLLSLRKVGEIWQSTLSLRKRGACQSMCAIWVHRSRAAEEW